MIWGNPGGSGNWNGEGEVSLGATWGQGGRARTTQEEGFQVSKEGLKERRELARGTSRGKPARGIMRDCAIA